MNDSNPHPSPYLDVRVLAEKQRRQSKGEQPTMECACGRAMPMRFLFKCLYCYCWFCEDCAEVHFGQTRAEYDAKRPQP